MTDTIVSNISSVALDLQTLKSSASAAVAGAPSGEEDAVYDSAGAAVFVVIVVTLYGLSIVLLLAFHVKGYDNSEDSQIDKYLKLQPAIRRQAEKDSFIHLRNQIGVRLFVRKFHAWLESTDDEADELRGIEVDAANRRPTFDQKLQRYVDVPIAEEAEEEEGEEGDEGDGQDGRKDNCEREEEDAGGGDRFQSDGDGRDATHNAHELDFGDPWIERRTRSYVHSYVYDDDVTTEDSYNYDYEALEATEDDSVYGTNAYLPDDEYQESDLYLDDDYLNQELYGNYDDYECDCHDQGDEYDSGRFNNAAFTASNSNSYDERNNYLSDDTRTRRYSPEAGEIERLLDADDVTLTTRITAV